MKNNVQRYACTSLYRFSLRALIASALGLFVCTGICNAQTHGPYDVTPSLETPRGSAHVSPQPYAVTPEGSSLMLLAGGLVPIAGAILYRRMRNAKTKV